MLRNIAVVGCGAWGLNYVRVLSELRGQGVVVEACDTRQERLVQVIQRFPTLRTTTDLDDVLDNTWLDAVVVSTPASTHYEIARQCLLAGKHVLVEKPLTLRVEESEDLIALAQARERVLMVGHTFLYNSGIWKMRECMQRRDFGQVYYLQATRTNLGPFRQDVHAVWDLAPHDVSICNYLLGMQPQWVSAVGTRHLHPDREDAAFITLTYPDNIIANIHVSWTTPHKVRQVTAVGSEQMIVFDDLNNVERVRLYQKGVSLAEIDVDSFGEFRLLVRDGDIISLHVEPSEPLKNQCLHFLECVNEGRQPQTDGYNGLEVVRVMVAIETSLRQHGAPVAVAA